MAVADPVIGQVLAARDRDSLTSVTVKVALDMDVDADASIVVVGEADMAGRCTMR